MFARKKIVMCAEDILCVLKSKVCDHGIQTVGKCANNRISLSDRRYRSYHWSTAGSQVLTTGQELPVIRMAKPAETASTLNCSVNISEDNLDHVDMEVSGSSSDEESGVQQFLYSQQRPVEFTSYGYHLEQSKRMGDLKDEIITVATFNVLSQTLLEMHRELYVKCKARDLKWSVRSSKLLQDFRYLDPDVFCLQEVEGKHVDEFFEKELGLLGYAGIYKKRTHDKVDGCAIYYKFRKFDLIDYKTVELFKPNVRLLDRDNIGIIVKLALKSNPMKHIVIATTHLLYTPRRADIRLTQTQVMLAEIERMAFRSHNTYWPIIFTGDMNYTPDSAVYELVERGQMLYEQRELRTFSSPSRKVLLPKSVGITDSCQFASVLLERADGANLQFSSGKLDHQLNFCSAYSHIKDDVVEATTYQNEWHTVDYIFYSKHKNKDDDARLCLVSRLGLPSSEQAAWNLRHLPNATCGSDHLPLMATFHFSARS